MVLYWNKYVGAWGGKAKIYKFKGFINNQKVVEKEIGPSNRFDLEVKSSKKELVNADTYDALRVRIRHVDEHNNLMQYSQRIVELKTEGPIQLIGPDKQTLLGGQLGVYVRSKNEKGTGKLIIKMDDIEKEISIQVK